VDVAPDGNRIEDSGGEVANGTPRLPPDVAGHGSAFRDTSGAMTTEPKLSSAPPSRRSAAREDEDVTVARGSERCPVAVRVLVEDVIADAHVQGHRDREPPGGRHHAQVTMRVIALGYAPAGVLAQTQLARGCFPDPVVRLARFAPQPELGGTNVARDALRGGSDAREFVVVDSPGAIHGDMVDGAALEHVDDVPVDVGADDMRPHHEDPRRAPLAGGAQPPC